MESIIELKKELEEKSNIDWFDHVCNLLKKEANPTVFKMMKIFGNEKPNPNNEIRGSKFLVPYDNRFGIGFIGPDLQEGDNDRALSYLGFTGHSFQVCFKDIAKRFGYGAPISDIYGGGTYYVFNWIPDFYVFNSICFWTKLEISEINDKYDLIFDNITFTFKDDDNNRNRKRILTTKPSLWQKIIRKLKVQ